MTLPSRHIIRNLSPGGLRPSTLLLSQGGSPQYWIFPIWQLLTTAPRPPSAWENKKKALAYLLSHGFDCGTRVSPRLILYKSICRPICRWLYNGRQRLGGQIIWVKDVIGLRGAVRDWVGFCQWPHGRIDLHWCCPWDDLWRSGAVPFASPW